jgi:hypothetical protein
VRWSVADAIRAARALAELDPVWLEEPTIPDDVRNALFKADAADADKDGVLTYQELEIHVRTAAPR